MVHRKEEGRHRERRRARGRHRRGEQALDIDGVVGQLVHEARVGAVLQQAAHEVGEQVAVLAHGRVHAAGHRRILHHLAVDALAHAVQALHFERGVLRARHLQDRGDGAGVVRGELRVDDVGVGDQRTRAGQVRNVGVFLVREHGVAGQAALLRALDLAVPIRALDQAHHEAQLVPACDGGDRLDDLQRARLVGLHGQAEAGPLRECIGDAGGERVQHVQRQLEAVGLLGVDRQVQVGARGLLDQRPHARQQLGEHALALAVFIAREQRGQLDRDAVGRLGRRGDLSARDRVDRVGIRGQVSLGVVLGARALAQHVVREAQAGGGVGRAAARAFQFLALALRFFHRLGDGAAQDELATQQLDGAYGGGDDRLRAQALEQPALALGARQELLRQRDGIGGDAGQDLVRAVDDGVGVEVGTPQLVGRQRDRGLDVRHPQQRLGQAHQREALGAGDRVLAQQRFHRPERCRLVAHGLHPRATRADHLRPIELALQRGQRGLDDVHLRAIRVGQAGLLRRRDKRGAGWRHGSGNPDWIIW